MGRIDNLDETMEEAVSSNYESSITLLNEFNDLERLNEIVLINKVMPGHHQIH